MNARPLKTIAAEIAILLKRETKHVIEIGGLLAEAQEQLDENEQWLSWLRDNFALSVRTAQRYSAGYWFSKKYDTVSHVSLTVSGLYALIEADRAGHSEAVEAALSEAKGKRIDDDRVWGIVAAMRPPPEPRRMRAVTMKNRHPMRQGAQTHGLTKPATKRLSPIMRGATKRLSPRRPTTIGRRRRRRRGSTRDRRRSFVNSKRPPGRCWVSPPSRPANSPPPPWRASIWRRSPIS
jgi:Protein of unknown function (DUF3102)